MSVPKEYLLYSRNKLRWRRMRPPIRKRVRDATITSLLKSRYRSILYDRRWLRYRQTSSVDDWNNWRWRLG